MSERPTVIMHVWPDELLLAARAARTCLEGEWPPDGIRLLEYATTPPTGFGIRRNSKSITVYSQQERPHDDGPKGQGKPVDAVPRSASEAKG